MSVSGGRARAGLAGKLRLGADTDSPGMEKGDTHSTVASRLSGDQDRDEQTDRQTDKQANRRTDNQTHRIIDSKHQTALQGSFDFGRIQICRGADENHYHPCKNMAMHFDTESY